MLNVAKGKVLNQKKLYEILKVTTLNVEKCASLYNLIQ